VLESPGSLRLEAAVPEALAHTLHMGDLLSARIDSIAPPLWTTISELGASADPISRTVMVKLDVPNLPELRTGMFGRLSVTTGEDSVIVVPTNAVVQRGQMELVSVVAEGRAHLRIIRTGRSYGDTIEVLAGLEDGESVAITNAAALVDGQAIEVLL
jgi:RND family efflux transporter MFP subunit